MQLGEGLPFNMTIKEDLTGREFGKLKVLGRSEKVYLPPKSKYGVVLWECLCACGNHTLSTRQSLIGDKIQSCKKCAVTYRSLPGNQAAFNRWLGSYKAAAKTRKHEFSLSDNIFRKITSKSCFYCGAFPIPYLPSDKRKNIILEPYLCNGIDRVNNEKGYVEENCVPCCATCNYMKRGMEVKNFLSHVNAIAKHQGGAMWEIAQSGFKIA